MYLNLKKLHGRASIQVDQKLHWWTNIILRFPSGFYNISLVHTKYDLHPVLTVGSSKEKQG